MELRPYGEDTIVIPFTVVGGVGAVPVVARMSRLRPRGEAFRGGVAGGEGAGLGGVVEAQYAPAAPFPFLPPVFVPGSPENEEFAHTTYEAGRANDPRRGSKRDR